MLIENLGLVTTKIERLAGGLMTCMTRKLIEVLKGTASSYRRTWLDVCCGTSLRESKRHNKEKKRTSSKVTPEHNTVLVISLVDGCIVKIANFRKVSCVV